MVTTHRFSFTKAGCFTFYRLMPRFLHTADWQVGKPFHGIEDTDKRERLRRQRLQTIEDLQAIIAEHELAFVVVCGDLFDSPTPDASTVVALCAAVGSLSVPVYAIPGNHDHAGPGCIWQQPFFCREREERAPNFHVLLEPAPVTLQNTAVFLPCPLSRRQESEDPTAWLRSPPNDLPEDLPRIVLAHGSTQGFSSSDEAKSPNQIDMDLLPADAYDYIALGDWHGYKEIWPKAWFSGTPEQDRFAKGEGNRPGHALLVEVPQRGGTVSVQPLPTGKIGWHAPDPVHLTGDSDLEALREQLNALLGNRTHKDVLRLKLTGALTFAGFSKLEKLREQWEARLLRLQSDFQIQLEPSGDELEALCHREDPLIARVARQLREEMPENPEAGEALRELYLEIERVAP